LDTLMINEGMVARCRNLAAATGHPALSAGVEDVVRAIRAHLQTAERLEKAVEHLERLFAAVQADAKGESHAA
jgi:hypothetical protein